VAAAKKRKKLKCGANIGHITNLNQSIISPNIYGNYLDIYGIGGLLILFLCLWIEMRIN